MIEADELGPATMRLARPVSAVRDGLARHDARAHRRARRRPEPHGGRHPGGLSRGGPRLRVSTAIRRTPNWPSCSTVAAGARRIAERPALAGRHARLDGEAGAARAVPPSRRPRVGPSQARPHRPAVRRPAARAGPLPPADVARPDAASARRGPRSTGR